MGKIGILQGLFKYVGCSDLSHEPRSDVASFTVLPKLIISAVFQNFSKTHQKQVSKTPDQLIPVIYLSYSDEVPPSNK